MRQNTKKTKVKLNTENKQGKLATVTNAKPFSIEIGTKNVQVTSLYSIPVGTVFIHSNGVS